MSIDSNENLISHLCFMKKIFFTLFILFSVLEGYSQKFVFSYDESGNRIKRQIGGIYNYYTIGTWFSSGMNSSTCKCFTSDPVAPPSTTQMYIDILSIDGQLAWDFVFPIDASTSTPRATITIRHLTDTQKFEKYDIWGKSIVVAAGIFYYLGGALLQERGPIPLADGDVVYFTYTIY